MGFLKLFGSKGSEQTTDKSHQKEVMDVFMSDNHKIIHDLKTPLNGISGMTQLLKETSLDENQEEYIGVIEESIRAMLVQIEKLSEDKKHKNTFKTVEIRKFLQQLLALMKQEDQENDLTIHYKIDRQFPIQLALEEQLIKKTFIEAFERLFLKRRKEILIEALYPADEDYALLIIRDKSLAFEDELKFIEQSPFSDQLTNKIDASSLSYSLMKSVDGKVRLEVYASHQQEETQAPVEADEIEAVDSKEVSSSLINEIKEEASVDYNISSTALDDKLILIAEDEVVGRVTLKLMLKERYNIIFAKNGKEAVELYAKRKPNLVLMDIMMPVMNGFEAFDQIEKMDKNRVPIIACTSKVISTEREYLTSYGFDDHLDKPIEIEKLDDILTTYMNT